VERRQQLRGRASARVWLLLLAMLEEIESFEIKQMDGCELKSRNSTASVDLDARQIVEVHDVGPLCRTCRLLFWAGTVGDRRKLIT